MIRPNIIPVWIGIIILSGMFLMGQDTWGPPNPEPIDTLEVVVKTGDVDYAGTDDNVYLYVNPSRNFWLDDSDRDDFERNQSDYFVFNGISLPQANFTEVRIVKDPDDTGGDDGGWYLEWVKVYADGNLVCEATCSCWIEDETTLFWTAPGCPDFTLSASAELATAEEE